MSEERERGELRPEEEIEKMFGTTFDKLVSRLSDDVLVEMGQQANLRDEAVENYSRPRSREYYRQRPKLEAGIMRIWKRNSRGDREKMVAFLRRHHKQEANQRPWWKFW